MGRLGMVMAADNTYAKQLAVALRSLSDCGGTAEYAVFVLQAGFDADLRERVEASCDGNVAVSWLDVADHLVDGVHLARHLSQASAYRLVVSTVLPSDLSRVVYLDSDVIVRNPLDELWSADLGGAPVGAVRDAYIPVVCTDVPWRGAGIDPSAPYFNAGMMVIELDRWRALDIATRGIALLREFELRHADQSALNMLFANRWHSLSPRWNVQTHHLVSGDRSRAWAFEDRGELERAMADPAIVHLTWNGSSRPWEVGSSHPFRDAWFEILDRTPWAGWRPRRAWAAGATRRIGRAGAALLGRASD